MEYTDQHRSHYEEHGYARLGHVLDATDLAELQQRIDGIMLGEIDCPELDFQLDGDEEEYGKMPAVSSGHKGATLAYRKIMGLELDPLFLDYMQRPLFRQITRRHIGGERARFSGVHVDLEIAGRAAVMPHDRAA